MPSVALLSVVAPVSKRHRSNYFCAILKADEVIAAYKYLITPNPYFIHSSGAYFLKLLRLKYP
jgi:hypothetical protein